MFLSFTCYSHHSSEKTHLHFIILECATVCFAITIYICNANIFSIQTRNNNKNKKKNIKKAETYFVK